MTLARLREGAEQVPGARVSYNFFDALGVAPVEGRTFCVEGVNARDPVPFLAAAGLLAAVGTEG